MNLRVKNLWTGLDTPDVSPYILEQFEKEVGYPFRPEYIINKGFNNSTFCVPTKEYRDFMDFQQREVCKLAKKFVDICHEYGKEAMMFLGDHWIGTEPYGKYFESFNTRLAFNEADRFIDKVIQRGLDLIKND